MTILDGRWREVVQSRRLRQFKEDNHLLEAEIKERTGAEEELNWKTAFLEAQVNSSIDGILVVDEQGRQILRNQRMIDLFNIPQHIADDNDDTQQLRWVADVIKNREPFMERVAYLYSHPNEIGRDEGRTEEWDDSGPVFLSPVVGKDEKYYGRIWTFRDITEQRRVEQDLKEAKVAAVVWEGAQRYNFLADTVPLILWTARPDGCLDYYNKAWFDGTGLTLAQTEDWGWGAVVHPDDLLPCIERWTRSFTTGEEYEIEYRFAGIDGVLPMLSFRRASARRNEAGEIVQWVGTGTDIDDQKRARSQLESSVADRTAELVRANSCGAGAATDRTPGALRFGAGAGLVQGHGKCLPPSEPASRRSHWEVD